MNHKNDHDRQNLKKQPSSLSSEKSSSSSMQSTIPSSLQIQSNCCWWCNIFLGETTQQQQQQQKQQQQHVACPIRYICRQVKSDYTPANSNSVFVIQESLSRNVGIQEEQRVVETKPYYEVVGQFCGYECCSAFIYCHRNSNTHFSQSQVLLNKILFESNNHLDRNKFVLKKAPHQKMFSSFGGNTKTKDIERARLAFDANIVHIPAVCVFPE